MNPEDPSIRLGYIPIWGVIVVVVCVLLTAGCVTMAKNSYAFITATPAPTPTLPPTPVPTIPTPEPTPESIPTLNARYVDPFAPGIRFENQWYKWYRLDVLGLKDLMVGVVAYRHAFLDSYTWWNHAQGNYQTQVPRVGTRFFVVWVHEEMLGSNQSFDPSMWAFDERAFRLQVRENIIEPDTTHAPMNRIKEFDYLYDYYNVVTAGPFSWLIRYTGSAPETGGFAAEKLGWLRMGRGNAHDGYIIFQIPEDTKERDVMLLGNFGSFGDAAWRYDPR